MRTNNIMQTFDPNQKECKRGMKRIFVVLFAALFITVFAVPALAYSRSGNADVYADFNAADGVYESGAIAGEENLFYLNGIADNTTFSIENGVAKIEMGSGGFVVFGQDSVVLRDEAGKRNSKYNYLVMRIRGEVGNENRTAAGGLLLFIGGGDGSHAITLNDRPTGVAPAALDAKGQPMNAISTEWQEFAIALNESNIRTRNDGKPVNGLNINTVSTSATLYIDDIYFTDTAPSTAAVYNPETSTANITAAGSDDEPSGGSAAPGDDPRPGSGTTDSGEDGEVADGGDGNGAGATVGGVTMLDPPTSSRDASAAASGSSAGLIVFIVSCVVTLLMAALFALVYFKLIKVKLD